MVLAALRFRHPPRRLLHRLLDHAPEEESRRAGARAGQGGAGARRARGPPRSHEGPAARLQPGQPGGQGTVVRRCGHGARMPRRVHRNGWGDRNEPGGAPRRGRAGGTLPRRTLADYLVRGGMAFRDAHAAVGRAVGRAVETGRELEELDPEELRELCGEAVGDEVRAVLSLDGSVASRAHPGGTAPVRVREAIGAARARGWRKRRPAGDGGVPRSPGRSSPGSTGTGATTCPGSETLPRTGCGFRRLCSSRPGSRRSSRTSNASRPGSRTWMRSLRLGTRRGPHALERARLLRQGAEPPRRGAHGACGLRRSLSGDVRGARRPARDRAFDGRARSSPLPTGGDTRSSTATPSGCLPGSTRSRAGRGRRRCGTGSGPSAERHTPRRRVGDYTQAIMDLGATLCTRTRPTCLLCPVAAGCRAHAAGNPTAYPAPQPKRPYPTREKLSW